MKLAQGERVICHDAGGRQELKAGQEYLVDCVYSQDSYGHQYVYLVGRNDLTPYRSDRFTPIRNEQ